MQESGYNLVVLPSVDKGAVDAGLKYVNNDACYPSILVTGQIMEALLSGKYDLEKRQLLFHKLVEDVVQLTILHLLEKRYKMLDCHKFR